MRLFFLFTLSILILNVSLAQQAHANIDVDDETREKIQAIPELLKTPLKKAKYKEEYISNFMRFMRSNGDNSLSKEALEKRKAEALLKAQKKQISHISHYDQNKDGIVTINETKEGILKNHPRYAEEKNAYRFDRIFKKYIDMDADNDEIISTEEMKVLSDDLKNDSFHRAKVRHYKKYLSLDPNNDFILTSAELYKLLADAFDLIDHNKDTFLSFEEKRVINNKDKKLPQNIIEKKKICGFPAVKAGQKVANIGIYEGTALSPVTTTDQDTKVTVATINIETKEPLYLILSSFEPVIWSIEGNKDAVKTIVVGNKNKVKDGEITNSGVVGIDKEKIKLTIRGCVQSFWEPKGLMFSLAQTGLPFQLGMKRTPHLANGIYYASQANILDDKITFTKKGEKKPSKMPDNYDKRIWDDLLKTFPDAVAKIKPSDVIAIRDAKNYETLPQIAGIAQLEAEKKIEIVEYNEEKRIFRILKNITKIPHYVSHHQNRYLLPPGINPPSNLSGSTCLISEETGLPLLPMSICRD